jgi:hypothetical protein
MVELILIQELSFLIFFSLLEEKGFCIAKILRKGLELRRWKPYMENFQYSNYVAISNKILNVIMR